MCYWLTFVRNFLPLFFVSICICWVWPIRLIGLKPKLPGCWSRTRVLFRGDVSTSFECYRFCCRSFRNTLKFCFCSSFRSPRKVVVSLSSTDCRKKVLVLGVPCAVRLKVCSSATLGDCFNSWLQFEALCRGYPRRFLLAANTSGWNILTLR